MAAKRKHMRKPTQNQVALVTGASRGLGRAIAVALAKGGRHVLVNFRANRTAAEESLRRIKEAGGTGELVRFDVADAASVEPAVVVVAEEEAFEVFDNSVHLLAAAFDYTESVRSHSFAVRLQSRQVLWRASYKQMSLSRPELY